MAEESRKWQEKLIEYCKEADISPPVWEEMSDRRGGRTAWSSKVIVQGFPLAARYWYSGENVNNAREDAAEVALQWLGVVPTPNAR